MCLCLCVCIYMNQFSMKLMQHTNQLYITKQFFRKQMRESKGDMKRKVLVKKALY